MVAADQVASSTHSALSQASLKHLLQALYLVLDISR
jgi:hypothetical protein